jgi:hypothetical protein
LRFLRITPCVALAALLVSCTEQGTQLTEPTDSPLFAKGGNSGPSANGQATLPLELYGGLCTFSFHATQKDGTVRGSFEGKCRPQDIEFHGNIDCLVINGNEAIIGGANTQARMGPDATFPLDVGWRVWAKVRDNGEGSNSLPDEFTDVMTWYPDEATVTACGPYPFEEWPDWVPDLVPIKNGNVQVKP